MDLNSRIPNSLIDAAHIVTSVIFNILFAIIFLIIALPYDPFNWFELGPSMLFGYTAGFFAISILIMVICSHFLLRFGKSRRVTWLHIIMWVIGEIGLISFIYAFLTISLQSHGLIAVQSRSFMQIFFTALYITAISLGIPYTLSCFYFTIEDKENTIRLMNYGNVVSDSEPTPQESQKVTLFGDDGLLKLSVNLKNLYYIESDDNYIKAWYSDANGEIKQYMLRCRLKTVEESFAGSTLIRCHRKYIVNLMRVDVLSREKDGYYVKLDMPEATPLPISKTYESNFLEQFNSR